MRRRSQHHHQHRSPTSNSSSKELEVVRVELLGGFRLWVGSRVIVEHQWRLKKARSLVKLLALAAGHSLHREQAMELLWPGLDSKAAANNLHYTLHVARRALEPSAPASASATASSSCGYLLLRDEQLTLCPGSPLWVDVEAFEEAAATARHAPREAGAFRAAIDLYAGELLPEDRYEPWVEERRAQLRELYLSLVVELAALYEERKEYEPAIEALGRVVAEEPAHEGAHVGLMRLYALSGRRREALGQYERLREALFKEFGREPEAEATRLQQEIWAGTFLPPDSPPSADFAPEEEAPFPTGETRHNLPLARTSFVGREGERLEVKRLLAMTRLLTLTGAGGCGKTRLALEVARDLVGAYPDGVWLVEFAPLSESELVEQAVAQALGVREQPNRPLLETLKDALRSRKMLMVMDNCEHLIEDAARLVDALLDSCLGLRILATSRETLNTAGEVNWVVPSLSVPDPRQEEAPTAGELEGYESVRLFVERARYRNPSFVLAAHNVQAVAQICRRLDGIPLAIELAAARVGVLSVEQISERLDQSLGILTDGRVTTPRHQTLRSALDWSYGLLDGPEKELFGRLSVFIGGWTLEASEAVGAGGGIEGRDVIELLLSLVDKSLVTVEPGEGEGAFRYGMLEPVRQYAREKLEACEDKEAVRRRHAWWYLDLAEEAEPELTTGARRRVAWLKRLETERGNFRAALSWALSTQGLQDYEDLGLRLATALWKFWNVDNLSEGRRWLEAALEKGSARSASRARALNEAGYMASWQGDHQRAMALLEESLTLFKELGNKPGAALALANLGTAAIFGGDGGNVVGRLREEAEALRSELSDRRVSAYLLSFLGMAALYEEGDHERMIALHEESLAVFREVEDVRGISVCLIAIAIIALKRGDHERAAALLEEQLRLLRKLREKSSTVYNLLGLAGVAALRGEPARAARLWGAAQALREATGIPMSPFLRSQYDYERYLGIARSRLDDDEGAWEAAWAEGRAMTPEEAVEYALSEKEEPAPEQQAPSKRPTMVLTPREQEISLLVAQGLTNRQIALELSISERTVENHIAKILKKLGFSSRARIATWVAHT